MDGSVTMHFDPQAVDAAVSYLRRRAERCRQLARQQFDGDSVSELTRLAGMFEQEAVRIATAEKVIEQG
jgi:hypothetical protein